MTGYPMVAGRSDDPGLHDRPQHPSGPIAEQLAKLIQLQIKANVLLESISISVEAIREDTATIAVLLQGEELGE